MENSVEGKMSKSNINRQGWTTRFDSKRTKELILSIFIAVIFIFAVVYLWNNIKQDIPWDFSIVPKFFISSTFYMAALATIRITGLGILFGLILGLIFSLLRISKLWILNVPAKIYIWIIRGTPLLLQIFVIYFGIASIIKLSGYTSAIIALGIHNGAYIAEIFRGTIISIDRGQKEAAMSLGMTPWKAMKRIILPQAFKRSVPPLGNQFIIALKDSSLASTIAIPELILRSRQLASSNFSMMEMLVVAGIYYLIMTSILTFIVSKIEFRLRVSEHRM